MTFMIFYFYYKSHKSLYKGDFYKVNYLVKFLLFLVYSCSDFSNTLLNTTLFYYILFY